MRNISKISVALTLILTAAGCAEQPGQYTQFDQNAGYAGQVISSPRVTDAALPSTGTQPISFSDSSLAEQVQQNLNRNSLGTADRGVNVTARDGDVTLTGTVPSQAQRRQVDEIVRNTPGVSAVYDQLQVSPSPTAPIVTPPVATPTGREYQTSPAAYGNPMATGDIFNLHVQGLNDTDRALAERILHGLRTDTSLNSLLPVVDIQVVNGRVILQGKVQNEQQRQTIGAVVARATGPGSVDNELQVTP